MRAASPGSGRPGWYWGEGVAVMRTSRAVPIRSSRQVDLVVALRTVLRLPEPFGQRIEGEPEGVPEPIGPHEASGERIVAGNTSARGHPEDLSGVLGQILGVAGVLGVRSEEHT